MLFITPTIKETYIEIVKIFNKTKKGLKFPMKQIKIKICQRIFDFCMIGLNVFIFN